MENTQATDQTKRLQQQGKKEMTDRRENAHLLIYPNTTFNWVCGAQCMVDIIMAVPEEPFRIVDSPTKVAPPECVSCACCGRTIYVPQVCMWHGPGDCTPAYL